MPTYIPIAIGIAILGGLSWIIKKRIKVIEQEVSGELHDFIPKIENVVTHEELLELMDEIREFLKDDAWSREHYQIGKQLVDKLEAKYIEIHNRKDLDIPPVSQ